MDKSQISRVREELISSNPDLSQDLLSDAKIEAAVEKVSKEKLDLTVSVKTSQGKPTVSPVAVEQTATGVVPASLEVTQEILSDKEIMNAVLEELQGKSNNTRVDNPELAGYVDKIFGLKNKE